METWEFVQGTEGRYSVSSYGRVRRNHLEKEVRSDSYKGEVLRSASMIREYMESPLQAQKTVHGYLKVQLRKGRGRVSTSVHRLVAEAFVPNPLCLPLVNHKDGNKTNNKVENLEWVTHSANNTHAVSSGLVSKRRAAYPPLTEEDVTDIRERYILDGEPAKLIAESKCLPLRLVWRVISREYYPDAAKHLVGAVQQTRSGKLTNLKVLEIRRRYACFLEARVGGGARSLARDFGVSYSVLTSIVKGLSWKDCHPPIPKASLVDILSHLTEMGLSLALVVQKGGAFPLGVARRYHLLFSLPEIEVPDGGTDGFLILDKGPSYYLIQK